MPEGRRKFAPLFLPIISPKGASCVMSINLQQDFFTLFGLPVTYKLDAEALDAAYRQLQLTVHPDKFAHLGDAEKRLSLQWATHVNEAYRSLRNPILRAQYVLSLNNSPNSEAKAAALAPQFLMEQMELREAVADAHSSQNEQALENLQRECREKTRQLYDALGRSLDDQNDEPAASGQIAQLMFLEKLDHEIEDALVSVQTGED